MRLSRMLVSFAAASLLAVSVAAQQVAFDLTGTWLFSVVTENGTGTPTITLKQKGDSISGTYESARMGSLPIRGIVRDSSVTFALDTEGGATLSFNGTIVDADNLKGEVDFAGMGGATFTAVRKK
jgi:hypothetical protein